MYVLMLVTEFVADVPQVAHGIEKLGKDEGPEDDLDRSWPAHCPRTSASPAASLILGTLDHQSVYKPRARRPRVIFAKYIRDGFARALCNPLNSLARALYPSCWLPFSHSSRMRVTASG